MNSLWSMIRLSTVTTGGDASRRAMPSSRMWSMSRVRCSSEPVVKSQARISPARDTPNASSTGKTSALYRAVRVASDVPASAEPSRAAAKPAGASIGSPSVPISPWIATT